MDFETLHQIEINLMGHLQGIRGPILDQIILALDNCDRLPFYTIAILLVWFVYRPKLGMQLFLLFVLCIVTNQNSKIFFAQPRPYHVDASLGLLSVASFGFPSGAAQAWTVFCGWIALTEQRRWVWILGASFLLLVSFSRVYLGVHFATDILGGWIIGSMILWGCYNNMPRLERYLAEKSKTQLVLLSVLSAIFLELCCLGTSGKIMIAAGLGACIGYIYAPQLLNPTWKQKVLRVILALVGAIVLQQISNAIRNNTDANIHIWTSAILFFLVGLWVSYGVPLITEENKKGQLLGSWSIRGNTVE